MEGLIDKARELLGSKDTAALVEFLTAESVDHIEALDAFRSLANEAYWEDKNLDRALTTARAGITVGLAFATESSRPYDLRSAAKALAFNLASFAWPGWDEEGVKIERHHLAEALDAARTNVRLAVELEKGSIVIGRGHWMVGATLLAMGRYQEAIAEFLTARLSADEGRSDVESAMAEGYEALVRVIERPAEQALDDELTEILERLQSMDDGATYAQQILTARRVFAS